MSKSTFSKQQVHRVVFLALYFILIPLIAHPVAVTAQSAPPLACSQLIPYVRNQLATNCSGLDRNQVCYGNPSITAELHDTADTTLKFASAGDVVPLHTIKSITTKPLSVKTGEWGLAVLKVQANLPGTTAGQAVTFILYGDTKITDAGISQRPTVTPNASATCQATTLRAAKLTSQPQPNQQPIKTLPLNTTVNLVGRTADGAWLLVDADGTVGWLPNAQAKSTCDVTQLPQIDPDQPAQPTAMQAFYFSTGIGSQAECKSVPTGLVIQSQAGSKVTFRINGVDMTIGSTVVLRTDDNRTMTLAVIRGQVDVKTASKQQTAKTGQQLSIPLDDKLEANGDPTEPRPIDDQQLTLNNTCGLVQAVEPGEDCTGKGTGSDNTQPDDKGGKATPEAGDDHGGTTGDTSGGSGGGGSDDSGGGHN